ncbi:restriction endonuclease subunit S [Agrobacterium sp. lyk4-40-TYG-31]|uniref:restriction endonuclease subunit S n=1 Tax=Agrobacterium sp. lyk4-40-TYG-31 TaxID=3040276 RepID=UPI002551313F|nr:restriction endonuclease subunit S [Agrobacterium sp. lyk4-40-TYG-31]
MSEVNPRVVKIPNLQKWEFQSLEQLCSHVGRGTAPRYVEQSAVKAIGQRCVSKQGFDSSFARPHSERALDGTLQAMEGDVLLNSTGTGTIGRSVVFRESGTFIVDGHVTALRPKVSKCSSTWLSAVLQSPWGQEHLERFCYAGSTNQVELSASALRVSAVPTPSYDEQTKIAEILDTLDSAIRGTEAVVAKLKAMKQGLLHDLSTRGIDANGDLRPPQPEAPHLYKQTTLGWLPKEWDVHTVRNLAQSSAIGPFGSDLVASDYRDEGVPVVFVRDIKPDSFFWKSNVFLTPRKALSLSAHKVTAGDVVATKMGFPPCIAAVYPASLPDGIITADVVCIRVNQNLSFPKWLSMSLNSHRVQRQVDQITAGVTRPKVTLRDVRELQIALPDLPEQEVIITRCSALDDELAIEQQQLEKLRLQKLGLMDELLTGRKPVTALL